MTAAEHTPNFFKQLGALTAFTALVAEAADSADAYSLDERAKLIDTIIEVNRLRDGRLGWS